MNIVPIYDVEWYTSFRDLVIPPTLASAPTTLLALPASGKEED